MITPSSRSDEKRAADRAKYAANPEAYRARSRAYGQRNKAARAAYTRAYREANREKVDAAKAARRKAHPEVDAAYAKAYRLRHPEKHKTQYRRANIERFGLTPASVAVLYGQQEGLCAICARPLAPGRGTHIDHDHKTGAVRALLCHSCNLMLGHAKDDPSVLRAAIGYLATMEQRPMLHPLQTAPTRQYKRRKKAPMNASGLLTLSGATSD